MVELGTSGQVGERIALTSASSPYSWLRKRPAVQFGRPRPCAVDRGDRVRHHRQTGTRNGSGWSWAGCGGPGREGLKPGLALIAKGQVRTTPLFNSTGACMARLEKELRPSRRAKAHTTGQEQRRPEAAEKEGGKDEEGVRCIASPACAWEKVDNSAVVIC